MPAIFAGRYAPTKANPSRGGDAKPRAFGRSDRRDAAGAAQAAGLPKAQTSGSAAAPLSGTSRQWRLYAAEIDKKGGRARYDDVTDPDYRASPQPDHNHPHALTTRRLHRCPLSIA